MSKKATVVAVFLLLVLLFVVAALFHLTGDDSDGRSVLIYANVVAAGLVAYLGISSIGGRGDGNGH
jgi:protein-S-isoprenylcysteine O-methyltransferase Ste14